VGGKEISSSPKESRGYVWDSRPQRPRNTRVLRDHLPAPLTESKEDLMLFPLQVELIHPEQRLKLLPADVVQDLLQCRMQRLEGCL
jgi:hypothetical protein